MWLRGVTRDVISPRQNTYTGMSARHGSAIGLPVLKGVHRLLRHNNCFARRRVPGDASVLLDEIEVIRNITEYKHPRRDFHTAVSVFRAKFSIMEKELNNAEIEKEQDLRVSESKEVQGSCKKRKSDDPEEQHGVNKRGKKRKGSKQMKPSDRYVPPPQKRNPGVSFNQEHFAETSYYFEGGLRKVHPYYFDFKTYCKGRWIGKTLLEVFSSEFRAEPLDYYKKAVKEGRIRLNETPLDDLNITLKVRFVI